MKYSHLKISKDFLEYEVKGTVMKNKNTFTVENFRNQIRALKYQEFYDSVGGKAARNDKLENYRLPAIVYSYYFLLITQKRIPTVQKLCESYERRYCEETKDGHLQLKKDYINGKNIQFTRNELQGRICRAYNSYHREVDILLQLIESYGKDYDFYYSFEEDFFKGVDIVCKAKDGTRYDIATYFSSARSKSFKAAKNDHRHEYKNINIDVVAEFEGPNKNVITIGDAKLYNKKAVKSVYKELTKKRG